MDIDVEALLDAPYQEKTASDHRMYLFLFLTCFSFV